MNGVFDRLRQGLKPRLGPREVVSVLAFASTLALSAACTLPVDVSAPLTVDSLPTLVPQPEQCQGDGAVQTWLLLPQDPAQSNLMAAYEDRQVIEFQAEVVAANDDPARLPHRTFVLAEVAEGITLTLDYQGDPPPLVPGPAYRMVAWNNPSTDGAAGMENPTPVTDAEVPDSRGYELQVFDAAGLLFLGATDVDMQDDPLDIVIEPAEGDCPIVPAIDSACVDQRQVQPLRVQWGDHEVVLYPGEDGDLVRGDAVYRVSVFRSRLVSYREPSCSGYYEHQRSVRIERLEPPPVLPTPSITDTLSMTLTSVAPETPVLVETVSPGP